MTIPREVGQLALDNLESLVAYIQGGEPDLVMQVPAIEALRAALAAKEPEPVAWMHIQGDHQDPCFCELTEDEIGRGWTQEPLYTAPPQRELIMCGCGDQIMPDDGAECGTCVTARNATQREWQGLTDEEWRRVMEAEEIKGGIPVKFARAIEAKLKEKNT